MNTPPKELLWQISVELQVSGLCWAASTAAESERSKGESVLPETGSVGGGERVEVRRVGRLGKVGGLVVELVVGGLVVELVNFSRIRSLNSPISGASVIKFCPCPPRSRPRISISSRRGSPV